MTRADLMLYRRMRGIFWGLLCFGILVLPQLFVIGFAAGGHFAESDEFLREVGRPGQLFSTGFGVATLLAYVAAVVLGATAGSVDQQRGVLRDLVLTGRSRVRTVVGRLLAALTWLFLFLAVSGLVTLALAMVLAPIDADFPWGPMAREVATVLPTVLHTMPFAMGIAMLVGSRGPAIAVYFVIAFLLDGVLSSIPKVRDFWEHVSLFRSTEAFEQWILSPAARFDDDVQRAALVIVAWVTIPFVAGLVRLNRRDL